jgi:hypothetical protein
MAPMLRPVRPENVREVNDTVWTWLDRWTLQAFNPSLYPTRRHGAERNAR